MKHIDKAFHWIGIILGLFALPGYVSCTLELWFGPAPFERLLAWLHLDINPSVFVWITILNSFLILVLLWVAPYLKKLQK